MIHEAGPTGFGLYRSLTNVGIRCHVAAPSKLQRPSGDRVKTEAQDAVHLARMLGLDEVTSVAIPSVEQHANIGIVGLAVRSSNLASREGHIVPRRGYGRAPRARSRSSGVCSRTIVRPTCAGSRERVARDTPIIALNANGTVMSAGWVTTAPSAPPGA